MNLRKRSSGILLHLTSLPGRFGIGDLGPEAFQFASMLRRCGIGFWQLLPVNPIASSQYYSPYSSSSAMAGNELLVSPELLAIDEFFTDKQLKKFHLPSASKVRYDKVIAQKTAMFQQAWTTWSDLHPLAPEFAEFKNTARDWLDDFTLFSVLSENNSHSPWNTWKKEWRDRDPHALKKFAENNIEHIEYEKWKQFLFDRQWKMFRMWCASHEVRLIGDLPFYVGFNSSDVWSHRNLFKINATGDMTHIAGVPPDYFNEDGQLWGMPVYDWNKVEEEKHQWWIQRVAKNIAMFDLIRLDHFRAFSAYWEVPAPANDARGGRWIKTPGKKFFAVMKERFGGLPFIAEDLGDIDEEVITLRDSIPLPGMRILQFAFDDAMPHSPYIPHNYSRSSVAYTGTHDNNTTRGWFSDDATSENKKQLSRYVGKSVNENNVAREMVRLCLASVADQAIIPMQDLLNLGADARMNTPSSVKNNWSWRLKKELMTEQVEREIKTLVELYNRSSLNT